MGALTEAVVFFKGSDVVKEMFFAEFEAVLDDVVGIPDFASDEIQAAFVQIEDTLVVTGVVFFIISFDGRGRVTGHWNIPLRHGSTPLTGDGTHQTLLITPSHPQWASTLIL